MNVITYHNVINENLHVHTCIMNVKQYIKMVLSCFTAGLKMYYE